MSVISVIMVTYGQEFWKGYAGANHSLWLQVAIQRMFFSLLCGACLCSPTRVSYQMFMPPETPPPPSSSPDPPHPIFAQCPSTSCSSGDPREMLHSWTRRGANEKVVQTFQATPPPAEAPTYIESYYLEKPNSQTTSQEGQRKPNL